MARRGREAAVRLPREPVELTGLRSTLSAALLLAACRAGPSPDPGGPAAPGSAPAPGSAAAPSPAPGPLPGAARCAERLAALSPAAGPPVGPDRATRAELLQRAKAAPVVFVRRPEVRGPAALRERRALEAATDAPRAVFELLRRARRDRALLRATLLPEGYLYAEQPALGAALTDQVTLEALFDATELHVARGAARLRLLRRGEAYEAADRPGERARLLLFDRVAASEAGLGAPLHRDLEPLRDELHFDELELSLLSETAAAGVARIGALEVPLLLRAAGERLLLDCEAPRDTDRPELAAHRAEAERRRVAGAALVAVIERAVDEKLPFDEPRTEEGQQDGKLRQAFREAYRLGQHRYEFNGDRYRVFDGAGRPRVPQVCVDFIVDTWERAGGSWYRPRGEPRERTRGRVELERMGLDNTRSAERLVDFAAGRPEDFEVVRLPEAERAPYRDRARFFAHLLEHRARYRPLDVVTILGLRADEKLHYHSFMVVGSDPLTGVPTLVAANAGVPRIRPVAREMESAPRRSFHARIRPTTAFLERVTGGGGGAAP